MYISKHKNLLSNMQKLADDIFYGKYIVIGIAESQTNFKGLEKTIEMLSIKEKDIVILINEYVCIKEKVKKFNFKMDVDLLETYFKKPSEEEWFYDIPIHSNAIGAKIIA